jgi:hypothetical protein
VGQIKDVFKVQIWMESTVIKKNLVHAGPSNILETDSLMPFGAGFGSAMICANPDSSSTLEDEDVERTDINALKICF